MIPGESFIQQGELELNAGAPKRTVEVRNTGDRPIQVGSHAHFYEVNAALELDRSQAFGFRPGESRQVELVAVRGERTVFGMNALVNGPLGELAP